MYLGLDKEQRGGDVGLLMFLKQLQSSCHLVLHHAISQSSSNEAESELVLNALAVSGS